jgi:hypothetical protein
VGGLFNDEGGLSQEAVGARPPRAGDGAKSVVFLEQAEGENFVCNQKTEGGPKNKRQRLGIYIIYREIEINQKLSIFWGETLR